MYKRQGLDNDVSNFNGTNTTQTSNISQGENMINVGAAFFQMAKISGTIWHDDNFDGNFDNNENAANSVNVNLYNDQFQLVESTSTNSLGEYLFDEVLPDDYYLSIDPPNGTAIIPQPNQTTYFDQSNGPNTSPIFNFLSGYELTGLNAGLGLGTVAIEDIVLSGEQQEDHILLSWKAYSDEDLTSLLLQRRNGNDWQTISNNNLQDQTQFQDYSCLLYTSPSPRD